MNFLNIRLNNKRIVDLETATADELSEILMGAHRGLDRSGPPTIAQLLYCEKYHARLVEVVLSRGVGSVEFEPLTTRKIVERFIANDIRQYVLGLQPCTTQIEIDRRIEGQPVREFWSLLPNAEYDTMKFLEQNFDRSDLQASSIPGQSFARWTKRQRQSPNMNVFDQSGTYQ